MIGRAIAALAFALTLGLTTQAAAQDASLPRLSRELPEQFTALPDARAAWVAARPTGYAQMVLPVLLDGVPVNAVIDTGAPFSVIDEEYAFEHSYGVRPAAATAPGARPLPASVPIRSLRFGGAERAGGRLYVSRLSSFGLFGLDVPVILGNDFLACCALELDYEHGRGRMMPSGARPIAGVEVAIGLAPGKDYYFTAVGLGGKSIDSVMIDTGGSGSLSLSAASWAAAAMPPPPSSIKLLTVSGPRVAGRTQIDALMLGATVVRGVGTTVLPDDVGLLDASRAKGLIGAGLLQRFHVLIDIGAKRMILGARDVPMGPDAKNTSGMQLARDGDADLVMHVLRNSPAERAGIKTGDRICAINGKPVAQSPNGWGSGMPGEMWALTLCDARSITLTLAEFY